MMMMMMMMMMSVVICDEIYRILFKNNICFSSLLCFLLFLSLFLLRKKRSPLGPKEKRISGIFTFFSLSKAESDVNFALFL